MIPPQDNRQIVEPQAIERKATARKIRVIAPLVKEQIFTAFVREERGRIRLSRTCGGVDAIDAVLREAIQELMEQGAVPRFRKGPQSERSTVGARRMA